MIFRTFQFDFAQLKLSVKQIGEVIGYNLGETSVIISDLISEALNETAGICTVKAEYTIFSQVSFYPDNRSALINNINFNINNIVYQQIKRSTKLAVFLCTAGHEIGMRSKSAMKEWDLLKGYLFDVIGTEIVEAATDLLQNELEREMELSGNKITNRYSPGYCGWDVAEQHKLFSLVPHSQCGIKLNQSALMDPIKSVSGFIGIGENVKFNPYTCSLCEMDDCIYRSKRNKIKIL